jgi:hypothetical protein
MFVIILNFESSTIDCLDLSNCPDMDNYEEFIEEELDYSLTNCQWMVVSEKLSINFLN